MLRSSSIRLRKRRGRRLIKAAAAGLSVTLLMAATGRFLLGPSLRTRLPGTPEQTMVTLHGGTFTMGSTEVEIEAAFYWCQQLSPTPCHRDQFERELPAHRVTVSAFDLDATEVTNQQFADWLNQRRDLTIDPGHGRLVSAGGVLYVDLFPMYAQGGLAHVGSRFSALQGYERRPVTQVTWDAAAAYCAAHGKRLPTEAEWEFAARGMASNRFPWGFEEPRCDGVVISRNKGQACAQAGLGPATVGTATQDRSPQGVFDLAGNVAEWVQDSFDARHKPCSDGPCVDPLVTTKPSPPHPELRMVRGSDWSALAVFGRAAARSRLPHDRTAGNIGFRCARSKSRS